ncbi:MAG TPA: hypothetical protein VIO62_06535 [Candidatus Dormibacteraeota bacterium]
MDERSRERRADRLPGPVDAHRDGKGTAKPRGVGPALPKREHADVKGAVREPGDQHGAGHDPGIAPDRKKQDAESGGEGAARHHQALPTLRVHAPERERGGDRRQAIDGPELADQDRIGMKPLKNHHRHGHDQDSQTDIHQ